MPAETLVSRARPWLPVIVAAGVVAVAGVVAIPLGGWDTVQLESEIIPEHAVGETFAAHRLSVTIDDLYVTDDFPDDYTEAEPGQSFLILVTTMEGLTAEPETPLRSPYPFTFPGWISLDEYPDLSEVVIFLERDGSSFPVLSPGVPETLLIVFPVSSGEYSEGDIVRVGITDATPEKADIIEGTRWVDEHIAVEVPIAVRDER